MLLHGHLLTPLLLASVHRMDLIIITGKNDSTSYKILAFLLRRLTIYVATFTETEGFPYVWPVHESLTQEADPSS